jgi:hypothetical protein
MLSQHLLDSLGDSNAEMGMGRPVSSRREALQEVFHDRAKSVLTQAIQNEFISHLQTTRHLERTFFHFGHLERSFTSALAIRRIRTCHFMEGLMLPYVRPCKWDIHKTLNPELNATLHPALQMGHPQKKNPTEMFRSLRLGFTPD